MNAINGTQSNFQEEVLNADKPVLLDFWAPWCGPCRRVLPIVEEIAEENLEIKVVKVNVDEESALANRYGIMTIPTLMVFKEGKVVKQVSGALSKTQILDMLDE